jgi:hypothetical protein
MRLYDRDGAIAGGTYAIVECYIARTGLDFTQTKRVDAKADMFTQ